MGGHRIANYECEAGFVQTTLQSFRSVMSTDQELHAGIVVADCDGSSYTISARFNGREADGTGDIEGQ